MKYFIRESTHLSAIKDHIGWGNGYVLLPEGHEYHGKDYDDIPVEVHGGLTFATKVTKEMLEHWDQLDESDLGKWMVGWDSAHYGDSIVNWPKEKVERHTIYLKEQLEKLK